MLIFVKAGVIMPPTIKVSSNVEEKTRNDLKALVEDRRLLPISKLPPGCELVVTKQQLLFICQQYLRAFRKQGF